MHALTHFLFADDVLFLCRASPQNLRTILDAFEFYNSLFGLHVNWKKSSIYFGKGISEGKITDFSFHFEYEDERWVYDLLGVPLFIGVPKYYWLTPWADKINSKLGS